jgi:predicted Zn-dependent protease with MMP-like domain
MFHVSDQEFEASIADAIDTIPDKYYEKIKNVVFTAEDNPSPEQRQKLHLRGDQTLFGLYEGIPLGKRGSNYSLVLPDKITIFKQPIEYMSHNLFDVKKQIHKTVWHEVAHYFGLSHEEMEKLGGI